MAKKNRPVPQVSKVKKETLKRLVYSQGGRIVTITSRKRENGDLRKFNCRMGVDMNNGGELKFDPDEKNLLLVFDMQKKAPRFVAIEGVEKVKAQHAEYDLSAL